MGRRIGISAEFVRPGRVGGTEQGLQYTLDGLLQAIEPGDSVVLFGRELTVADHGQLEIVSPPRPSGNRFFQELATFRTYCDTVDAWFFPNYHTPRAKHRCRVMTTIPDLQYLHYPQNFSLQKRAWLRWAHDRSLRRADRISVYSNWVREDILDRYGSKWGDKIVTIPIPVSWERFGTGTGRKRERPYLLTVGGHYLHKNLSTLLTAFHEVHSHRPDVQLVVVGQTGESLIGVRRAEDIRGKIDSLGLEGAVEVTGFIPPEELGDLYRGAELFVFPSVFEGFGLPPVEAIGFGLPVLTTNRTSLPEVIRGLAATVDDPLDASGMAERILHMLDTARRPEPEAVLAFREHYCPRAIGARVVHELID